YINVDQHEARDNAAQAARSAAEAGAKADYESSEVYQSLVNDTASATAARNYTYNLAPAYITWVSTTQGAIRGYRADEATAAASLAATQTAAAVRYELAANQQAAASVTSAKAAADSARSQAISAAMERIDQAAHGLYHPATPDRLDAPSEQFTVSTAVSTADF